MASFVNLLDAHEFGDRVTLTVRRGDERVEVPVTLGAAGETRVR
jgi:S1-C subfamily serine protease